MTKPTKHTVTLPDGRVATRSSARTYTHVIIAQENLKARREQAHHPDHAKIDAKNWRWYKAVTETPAGHHIDRSRHPGISFNYPVTQSLIDEYMLIILEFPTAEEYCAHRLQHSLEWINKAGTGDLGGWHALQWSMSEVNARKGINSISTISWTNIRIVQVESNCQEPA